MKARLVLFAPEAVEDLEWLYGMIADDNGPERALGYLSRLQGFCNSLALASERGRLRDDVRPGLRIVGFERRVTLAFTVEAERVVILRCFYGGADWESTLKSD